MRGEFALARRKKEPQSVHRKKISMAAEQLFMKKGIENTSMNDIAKESGYSKATLYVYFKDKEQLVSVLVLESMQKLHDYIRQAVGNDSSTKECYDKICNALVEYQEEYPFYFDMVLKAINIDFETTHFLPEEKETFLVGERINELLSSFLKKGIEKGEIRSDIEILPTIFSFWGMLSGVVLLASNKEEYITQHLKHSKKEFLLYGFEMLYRSIAIERRGQ